LIFSKIDDKQECIAIYYDNSFYKNDVLDNTDLNQTWSYSPYLENKNIEYAQIYVKGQDIKSTCPDEYKEELRLLNNKLNAYFISFKQAKLDPEELCLHDLIPAKDLKHLCDLKIKITDHVFKTVEKPENYDFLLELYKFIKDISVQKLNLDYSEVDRGLSRYAPYIKYKLHGTKTNRFTTLSNSFPILTLNKEHRKILKPNNDYFVELDYNGADIRVALGLLGLPQPQEDLYKWVADQFFNGLERGEVKKKLFSWLYNPKSKSPQLESVFDRVKLLSEYWDGEYVYTLGKEKIEADLEHALAYLVQGSQVDVFGERAIAINKFLKSKKSKVAWVIHDSITIDYCEEEGLIDEIIELFSDTILGKFKVNVLQGKDFGSMKNVDIGNRK
jgi:hypothetical protein